MCGCPMCRGGCARRIGGKCPFYAGYEGYEGSAEGFAGPMDQLYPKLDHRSSEGFGTSPGTMTQLATSHVPSESDVPILKQWLADRKEGVYMMTEQDLDNDDSDDDLDTRDSIDFEDIIIDYRDSRDYDDR